MDKSAYSQQNRQTVKHLSYYCAITVMYHVIIAVG